MGYLLILMFALFMMPGCTTLLPLQGSGMWTDRTVLLGPVEFCRGGFCDDSEEGSQWPLAFAIPPHPEVHYQELRAKAAKIYQVPETEIILKNVSVSYTTELVGTVRGWKVTATAGRAH